MKETIITIEQLTAFRNKNYSQEPKPDLFCNHDKSSHEVLVPIPPSNENEYYSGTVVRCIECNREVEAPRLMKFYLSDIQKAYTVPWNKGESKTPKGLSPRTKINPPSWKKPTSVYIHKPFIF